MTLRLRPKESSIRSVSSKLADSLSLHGYVDSDDSEQKITNHSLNMKPHCRFVERNCRLISYCKKHNPDVVSI